MSKTAIVLGATGLIGSSLVDKLSESDHIGRVVAVTRRRVEYFKSKVHNEVVDFRSLEDFSYIFNGDILFSALGTTKREAGSVDAQRIVDLDYQYKAALMASENGVKHYLLVSSSGANGKSKNAYLQMKGELENRIMDLSFERTSIFQPSLLIGDRPEFRLGEKVGSAIMPLLCSIPGLRKYKPIRGEQVAERMVLESKSKGDGLEWFILDDIFV